MTRWTAVSAMTAGAWVFTAAAWGQEGSAPAVSAKTSAEAPTSMTAAEAPPRRTIEEIVVTAQKTEQSLHEVPISMSVVDDEFMSEQGITDFRDLSQFVPNVAIDARGRFPDVRIRGFGSPVFNKAFEQGVGLVIDGVAYGVRPYFQGPLFDLDRVEVLRGPQGTLFGKNTTAGLLNVVTKQPTDDFTGVFALELGEIGRRRFEGALGGPLVAKLVNFRIAGLSDELFLVPACEQLAKPVSGVNFLSAEQEAEVSAQFAREVTSKQRLLRDPEVNAYVDELGQRLVGTLRDSSSRGSTASSFPRSGSSGLSRRRTRRPRDSAKSSAASSSTGGARARTCPSGCGRFRPECTHRYARIGNVRARPRLARYRASRRRFTPPGIFGLGLTA